MKSLFVSGTDTNVGKTCITAGLVATFRDMGVDVGVMKPFAAGTAQKTGFKSSDAEMLAEVAGVDDPEDLINPQFFPVSASPYTAWKTLGIMPDILQAVSRFQKLSRIHDTVLVEGMGGIMTPIKKDYFVADLAREMGIPALLVASTRIGTINHTVMTTMVCKKYGIPVLGIVLNDFEAGYDPDQLAHDLEELTSVPILGTVPFLDSMDGSFMSDVFRKSLDLEPLK